MRCVQEGETQDSTGNTGNTGNMHRLGKGQDMRDYYTMNNRKKGQDLATTEFRCGTRFWDSRRLCGRDNCGCRDWELAVLVSNVTWVLRDITVFPPQGPRPEVLRYVGMLGVLPWRMANVGS